MERLNNIDKVRKMQDKMYDDIKDLLSPPDRLKKEDSLKRAFERELFGPEETEEQVSEEWL